MRKRVKKISTGLFFDSLKHMKNNLSNLVSTELLMLEESYDLSEYLSLKPVNAKSKLPDMKKIGLVNYRRPSDNTYSLSDEGAVIFKIIKNYSPKFRYPLDLNKRVKAINASDLVETLNNDELKLVRVNLLKLLLSYFDTADFIRPYLLLVKIIDNYNLDNLENDILYNILAQPKLNILNNRIEPNVYDKLDSSIQQELRRPTSYIRNFLQTAMIIDQNNKVIYDKDEVKNVILELEEVDYESLMIDITPDKKPSRSASQQKDFRLDVLKNFNYKCAISGNPIIIERETLENIIILEAAHIIPYSEGGSFSYTNGIPLTPELHKLFDLGLFTFTYADEDTLKVIVTSNKKVKDNGLLNSIKNKTIDLRTLKKGRPDEIAIEYRSKKII